MTLEQHLQIAGPENGSTDRWRRLSPTMMMWVWFPKPTLQEERTRSRELSSAFHMWTAVCAHAAVPESRGNRLWSSHSMQALGCWKTALPQIVMALGRVSSCTSLAHSSKCVAPFSKPEQVDVLSREHNSTYTFFRKCQIIQCHLKSIPQQAECSDIG